LLIYNKKVKSNKIKKIMIKKIITAFCNEIFFKNCIQVFSNKFDKYQSKIGAPARI
tara:strand:+ start:1321 stop:1488 length:168 start_codon:yes stop_codon:yes gene_type:complete